MSTACSVSTSTAPRDRPGTRPRGRLPPPARGRSIRPAVGVPLPSRAGRGRSSGRAGAKSARRSCARRAHATTESAHTPLAEVAHAVPYSTYMSLCVEYSTACTTPEFLVYCPLDHASAITAPPWLARVSSPVFTRASTSPPCGLLDTFSGLILRRFRGAGVPNCDTTSGAVPASDNTSGGCPQAR